MGATRWEQYLAALKTNFHKVVRLEFLQPDGSVAFMLDNDPRSKRSRTFIQDGQLSVNLQNGARRTATVKLSNLDGQYDFNVNNVWFGTQVRLLMGLVLPDGSNYLIPQGTFYVKDPEEARAPKERTATYNLVDKWAVLDGTLGGELEGTYECPVNSNIFSAISSILSLPTGNGQVIDRVTPVFTNYYNDMTVALPNGSTVSMVVTPYTARFDATNDTYATVILELNQMLAGWIGYDAYGALRLDPSQDDILDTNKPILWTYSPNETQWLGATYTVRNSDVKNDIIRVGESLDSYAQVGARAQNYDPSSDTNINVIGLRTDRDSKAGYYTNQVCADLTEFDLKRQTILKKSVSISSTQMFHLVENNLVAIRRLDKQGEPTEKHLVNSFSIPIGETGQMTVSAVSVQDFPIATVTTLSNA